MIKKVNSCRLMIRRHKLKGYSLRQERVLA